ncbi:MAG: RNA polymerase factor sigma-54 [Victivallales bacterium]|jgi:RNA polymerase sigma-54 factor|nr:RNA polymerase factor sigma-54 [Victivallales bacterium]
MPEHQQILDTSLRQEQQLSVRQLQSLELLHLPLLELEEKLLTAMENNPLLESEYDWGIPEVDSTPNPTQEDESTLDAEAAESDEWCDDLPLPTEYSDSSDAADKRDFLINSLSDAPGLQEQLQLELATLNLPENLRRIADDIIGGIDDSGYLRSTVADISMSTGESVNSVEEALKAVQSLDPPGVGCRDLAECLRLQLERKHALTPILAKILDSHLDEIAKNHLPQLARTLKISLNELNSAILELRKLAPFPGTALAPEHADFIVPEVEIVKSGDTYEARSCKNSAPRLFLAERYLKLLETPNLPPEDRAYLKEKLQQARDLMRALELRKSTIVRIAEIIAKTQRDFLEQGVEYLRPLTMRQIGEELNLHETTISRAVANKYVLTGQGIFPLKFFFNAGFTVENGAELSNRAIMEKIRELIQKESPVKPLSDEQLAKQLKSIGIPVARRTVAKYREAIGIPSSNLRRQHS